MSKQMDMGNDEIRQGFLKMDLTFNADHEVSFAPPPGNLPRAWSRRDYANAMRMRGPMPPYIERWARTVFWVAAFRSSTAVSGSIIMRSQS